jgi:surfeit locus 1 family protein
MFKEKRILIPLILTIPIFIILISLGFWQLNRLKEKKLFIETVDITLNRDPVTLPYSKNPSIYSKIKTNGYFLENLTIYLYGLRSMSIEKNGYYLLVPFKTDDNRIIMVARGWFSHNNKGNISLKNNHIHQEIIGVVLPPEKQSIFIPKNDHKNNIWFTLDLKEMSENLGLKLENFYLIQLEPENLPEIITPLDAKSLLAIRNDHLGYAITWFSLAFALLVIFGIYYKNNQKIL